MKRILICTVIIATMTIVFGCKQDVDPVVATHYFENGTPQEMKNNAFLKLYEFYSTSDKTKEYYEVIARKQVSYIVNYNPSKQLLTICQDPGSGWSDQVSKVSESELKRIVDLKISLDSLASFVYRDFTLKDVNPMIPVKTNGNPSL